MKILGMDFGQSKSAWELGNGSVRRCGTGFQPVFSPN